MTSHTARLYALALGLLVFFMTWAAVAAKPWKTATAHRDPRVAALVAREQRIRHESLVVKRIVERRWVRYRVELRRRQSKIAAAHRAQLASAAAAPSVRVVTLPPLTITRTS